MIDLVKKKSKGDSNLKHTTMSLFQWVAKLQCLISFATRLTRLPVETTLLSLAELTTWKLVRNFEFIILRMTSLIYLFTNVFAPSRRHAKKILRARWSNSIRAYQGTCIEQEIVFQKDKHRLDIGSFEWEDITNEKKKSNQIKLSKCPATGSGSLYEKILWEF